VVHRNKKINNLRRTIRVLQELPIVISVFVIANFLFDTIDVDADWLLAPLAGGSIYVLVRLYMVSRIMYVSKWAKILYITLIAVCSVDVFDIFFDFSDKFICFQEITFCMMITGVIVSFCTFIYDKFKYGI